MYMTMSTNTQDFWNTSGAALNIKRPTESVKKKPKKPLPPNSLPPKSKSNYNRKTVTQKSNSSKNKPMSASSTRTSKSIKPTRENEKTNVDDLIPCIDLMNFDCSEYENSKYVLTSPRSLEACERLNILPMDLLYKHLQDFEEESPGMPVSKLLVLYDNYETIRKDKLRRARLEREKIIDEENESRVRTVTATKQPVSHCYYSKTRARNVSFSDDTKVTSARKSPAPAPIANQMKSSSTNNLADFELKDYTNSAFYKEIQPVKHAKYYSKDSPTNILKKEVYTDDNRFSIDAIEGRRSVEYYEGEHRPQRSSYGHYGSLDAFPRNTDSKADQVALNRARMDEEFELYNQKLLDKHKDMLEKAEKARIQLEEETLRRRADEKRRREMEHAERMRSTRSRAENDVLELRSVSADKERSAQEKQDKINAEREKQLRKMAIEKIKKIRSSAQKRQQLDKELDDFKQQIKVYRDLAQERAASTVERRVAAVSALASNKEHSRQRLAKQNLRERNAAEAVWRKETQHAIAERERNAERKRRAQEEYKAAAAAISAASANKRVDARGDSFDKLVLQAELVNKLGLGQAIRS